MGRRLNAHEIAFLYALAGGLIFIAAGWSGQRGIESFVDLVRGVLGQAPFLRLFAVIMASVAYLGGFAVILGGLAILNDHVWGGCALIYLGAGGGAVALVAFSWLLVTQSSDVAAHEGLFPVVLGLALSVIAQWKARSH